ncbi:MAG: STAS domain-containing protein [Anaerolineae bacterium]|nr:STAS domain-containing protein [Anaerolineae bacterium]
MEITIEQKQGQVPVTVMKLTGNLDGSNYQEVISKGKELYEAGTRYLLIDMSEVPFMGSAGLVALHNLALLMQENSLPEAEDGWSALHAASLASKKGKQTNVKILSPRPSVDRGLERTGMRDFFDIHTDLETALASF